MKPTAKSKAGKFCLVLDLDETLVHSSFSPMSNADYVIPVSIEDVNHSVFVLKRPGVDEFMKKVGEHFEIVIYTASLSKYADPLLDKLDVHKVIDKRLFRENCVFIDGHFVKDLSLLNRNLSRSIIVDNSPVSYKFHPENAIDCTSFIDDPNDVEMWQIADFLISIKSVDDVRSHCRSWRNWCERNPSIIPSADHDQL
jgi:RNA polymerase II subunit A small phosphatase-like protein